MVRRHRPWPEGRAGGVRIERRRHPGRTGFRAAHPERARQTSEGTAGCGRRRARNGSGEACRAASRRLREHDAGVRVLAPRAVDRRPEGVGGGARRDADPGPAHWTAAFESARRRFGACSSHHPARDPDVREDSVRAERTARWDRAHGSRAHRARSGVRPPGGGRQDQARLPRKSDCDRVWRARAAANRSGRCGSPARATPHATRDPDRDCAAGGVDPCRLVACGYRRSAVSTSRGGRVSIPGPCNSSRYPRSGSRSCPQGRRTRPTVSVQPSGSGPEASRLSPAPAPVACRL